MDTSYIKRHAIAKALGELFTGASEYDREALDRWGDPMVCDEQGLIDFQSILSELSTAHRNSRLTVADIEDAREFVRKIGFNYGHVTGSYTTGTWGVRYTALENIITILSLPDGVMLLNAGETFEYYGQVVQVQEYQTYHSMVNWLAMKVQSVTYPESHPFNISINWKDLHILYAPIESEVL